jgi:CspA family cold shock protein
MHTGTVKTFIAEKGYGFITPDGGGSDVFVHHTNIEMDGYKELKEGQRVSYVAVPSPKGKGDQAENVKVISD